MCVPISPQSAHGREEKQESPTYRVKAKALWRSLSLYHTQHTRARSHSPPHSLPPVPPHTSEQRSLGGLALLLWLPHA